MMKHSLQPIPAPDQFDEDAETFGAMILAKSTPEERQPVVEYGRYILAGAPPSHGCATRFFGAIYILSKRMPGYNECIAAMKTEAGAISRLQSKIALYVLLNEPAVQG